MVKTEAA